MRKGDDKIVKYRPTRVQVDNDTSRHYTIIDIFTYDRVGLLYDITRTISQLGYEIYLSSGIIAGIICRLFFRYIRKSLSQVSSMLSVYCSVMRTKQPSAKDIGTLA